MASEVLAEATSTSLQHEEGIPAYILGGGQDYYLAAPPPYEEISSSSLMVANSNLYSFDYAPPEVIEELYPTKEYGEEESSPALPHHVQLDHSYAIKAPPPALLSPPDPLLEASSSTSSSFDAPSSTTSAPTAAAGKKCRNSAIKYIIGDGGRKRASESKLESLLKAPIRKSRPSTPPTSTLPSYQSDVDILTPPPPPRLSYDGSKARNLMNECEKYVNFARPNDVPVEWEASVVKTGWTRPQRALYEQTLRALHSHHLSRLSYAGHPAEPILRRVLIDSTSSRLRAVLTRVSWDPKLTQWLHGVLKDNLSWEYLSSYMDVLQTLRSQVPTLVDRMILLSTAHHSTPQQQPLLQQQSAEALNLLLKRQWDPFATLLKQNRVKKLKYEPLFLFVPHSVCWTSPVSSRRLKSVFGMLGAVGKPLPTPLPPSATHNSSVDECAEKMVSTARQRLLEVKSTHPDRPLFLVGWGPGALVAVRVAMVERVAGLICLGFPLLTLEGVTVLGIKYPTLFVVGSRARNCSIPALDSLRSRLPAPSALVVVKGADEYLNVSRAHKREMLVTQTAVDKILVEEVTNFISSHCSESMVECVAEPRAVRRSPSKVGRPPSPKKQRFQQPAEPTARLATPTTPEFDEEYDEAKRIPSNSSSSRRKAYYRAASTSSSVTPPLTATQPSTSASVLTASQLLQQQHGGPASRGRNDSSCSVEDPQGALPAVVSSSKQGSGEGAPLPALVPTQQQQNDTNTPQPEPLVNGGSPNTPQSEDHPSHQLTTHFNKSEIERLNSALLSKRATDLSTLLGSGKRVIIHKTLVKRASTNGAPPRGPGGEKERGGKEIVKEVDEAVAAEAIECSENPAETAEKTANASEPKESEGEVTAGEDGKSESELQVPEIDGATTTEGELAKVELLTDLDEEPPLAESQATTTTEKSENSKTTKSLRRRTHRAEEEDPSNHNNSSKNGPNPANHQNGDSKEHTTKEAGYKNLRSKKSSEAEGGSNNLLGKRKLSSGEESTPLKELDGPLPPKMGKRKLKRAAATPVPRTARKCV